MCRMYNDYRHIAGDGAECTLNSVDFPEFAMSAKKDGGGGGINLALATKKKTLALQSIGRRRQMDIWTMFWDVTDLYGQVHIVKDVASWMSNGNMTEGRA
ncbi:uncharacterized protein GGS22DRAFT_184955 [Annulohypoxylon maeteangense]|uniref:uncharacterized protein n=1 Tax=Annulohypoxylon maeteangense TaxID=1927788 RepID=UPI002008E35D|nr:uncharacterized protein GGS22DRAFT_184955 [Annulohypoxylon maeteangense]KAI0889378.1 hypothetical protein GGS22DRAFT_184955 [Annulohypoxylon maeteangense]